MPCVSDWEDRTFSNAADGEEKAGGRLVLLLLLGLAVLLGALYVGAWAIAGDNVPRGTTVSGVSIGGHPQDQAAERLQAGLADRVNEPIEVLIDGNRVQVEPARAGLSVDYDASVAEAGGERSWDPSRLWDYFTGGDDLEAVVEVDDTAFDALVARLDKRHGREPREGAVGFQGDQVTTVQPRAGEALDPAELRDALATAYVDEQRAAAEVELVSSPPDIDQTDVARARNEFANPAVRSAVELRFEGSSIRLEPKDYTPALSLAPVKGRLEPRLDTQRLDRLLATRVSDDGAPVDATVALVGGSPQVIPARPGVTYDRKQVHDGFLDLVAAGDGKRTLQVDAKVARPEFTTKEARELGIKERVSTFTTYFPHADYRNTNIGRAAELVNGTLLKPDEIFSLNDTVGERTRANGFTEGYVISDGIFKEELGGGVSQMATTTFNAMFFAGLEDVEHKPHSFYIDRYPIGREATVVWGAVDLQFRNDTPYGVLVQANVTPSTPTSSGVVTVSMWSTKYWDITSFTGERYNLTEQDTRTLRTKDCYPNEGYGGFDIDVVRHFRRAGESQLDHSETFTTTYTPSDTVICLPPRSR
jgi:vancomycin resistance protein YoaR